MTAHSQQGLRVSNAGWELSTSAHKPCVRPLAKHMCLCRTQVGSSENELLQASLWLALADVAHSHMTPSAPGSP